MLTFVLGVLNPMDHLKFNFNCSSLGNPSQKGTGAVFHNYRELWLELFPITLD